MATQKYSNELIDALQRELQALANETGSLGGEVRGSAEGIGENQAAAALEQIASSLVQYKWKLDKHRLSESDITI